MSKRLCPICQSKLQQQVEGVYDDRYGAKGRYSIYQCVNCGHAITSPAIPHAQLAALYSRYYPTGIYTSGQIANSVKTPSPIIAWLTGFDCNPYLFAKKGDIVLDVGSGTGVSLLAMKKLGAEPYGIEPDPNARTLGNKLGMQVCTGFITGPCYRNMRFNLITASQVLEHEPDPAQFLRHVRKRLSEDGRAILSLPNSQALYRYLFGKRWLHWHIPYHLHFFTRRSLNQLANNTGFCIRRLRTITPTSWTVWQLKMLTTHPPEGIANPVWQSITTCNPLQTLTWIPTRVTLLLTLGLECLLTPLNRLLDLFGWGESFLVELQPINSH